jgi:ribonuclease D
MNYTLHEGDLPAEIDLGPAIAVDTETMGLSPYRDRLCLVQLSAGDGTAHLVRLSRHDYAAPNLKRVLGDPATLKIFHFARFDVAALSHWLGIVCMPVYCTKIASRLARTYTDRHGYRDLCKELLGVDISKHEQTSDWGAGELSDSQLRYAASDVLHLHALRGKLEAMLQREGRLELAAACFAFLPVRATLDLHGWSELDIFAH